MAKEEAEIAFNAGGNKAYHYDKKGINTAYYTKWESFEHWWKWYNNNKDCQHETVNIEADHLGNTHYCKKCGLWNY